MKDSEYTQTRKTALNALNHWATTGLGQFTMRDIIRTYLEAAMQTAPPSVANRPLSLVEK